MSKRIYLYLFVFLFSNLTSAQITLSGTVANHSGEPLPGIVVSTANADPVISDENGVFTFNDLPAGEDYLITATHETNIYDGVTVLDLLFTANIILGLNEYSSPAQLFAGDYNFSGNISTFDLVMTRKAIIRQELMVNGPIWGFFNANTSIPNSGIYLSDVTEDILDLEMVGAKQGNIALETDHMPAPVNAPVPVYYFEDQQVVAGETFTINVQADDFQSIAGFQHGIHWDNVLLDFVSMEFPDGIGGDYNASMEENGDLLLFAGHYLEGFDDYLYLEDGATVYSLTFQAIADISSLGEIINFSGDIIPLQTVFATSDDILYLLEDQYQTAVVTSVIGISALDQFLISPSLTNDISLVELSFSSPLTGELQLLDMNGRLLDNWKVEGSHYQTVISMNDFPNGTYALQLRTNEGVVTKRVIKQD